MTRKEPTSADLPGVERRPARISGPDVVRITTSNPVLGRPYPVPAVRPTPFAPLPRPPVTGLMLLSIAVLTGLPCFPPATPPTRAGEVR
ncbi:hypothetical protein [Streptomyces neyagawaensis]|uniref:hypothetical protein n=1 Tax=Streptomyces neyagawaensis TaxID=42238 RepID=UPI000AA4A8A1|nr:hypothetical protein [Streptomyces neyagawaensis]MCL6738344.1 hypothetical protein [Streptomyces neyagawaensis]MDE1688147.1 hypothetical protein [Streptomyces neyagawaensis]